VVQPLPFVNDVAIRARGLVLAWDERTALASSDFDVPAGRVTALIGPNGSGKSTLLHAFAGLLEPVAGELTVSTRYPKSDGLAYVLQATKVNEGMPVTVREVVLMGRFARLGMFRIAGRVDREACDAAMDRLGIGDLRDRHLDELSGGQRQRVFVAQGLVQEADVLLLDEPLTGLDLVSKETIQRVVAEERDRGTTVIMTTHDLPRRERPITCSCSAAGRCGRPAGGRPVTCAPFDRYGIALTALEDGAIVLDDAHHRAAGARHTHFDRTGHAEHHHEREAALPGGRAALTRKPYSAEHLRLEGVELVLGDGAGVEQGLGLRYLIGGAPRACYLLGVALDHGLLLSGRGDGPLAHAAPTHEQVHERAEEGQEQQHDDPDRLGESAQVVGSEQVPQHAEQDHEEGDPDRQRQEEPDDVGGGRPEVRYQQHVCLSVLLGEAARRYPQSRGSR
jgi:iron complex transport system ATP-binding protein